MIDYNYEGLAKMNQHHIFFDVETSHLDCELGEIIEIAAIRTDEEGNTLSGFYDKIKPTKSVDLEAAKINRYNEKDWKNSVPFITALDTLKSSIIKPYGGKKFVVVAHVAQFDKTYLQLECKRYKQDEPFATRYWIDTAQLAWPFLFSGIILDRKLNTLCKFFDVDTNNLHNALRDVEALSQVYWRMMKRYKLAMSVDNDVRKAASGLIEKFIGD